MPRGVGERKGGKTDRAVCVLKDFPAPRQFRRKLYRPLNRAALRSWTRRGVFRPSSLIEETPRAGSAMFGRGGKKTRTRIEPRLDWRGGGEPSRRRSSRRILPTDPPDQSQKRKSAPLAVRLEARENANGAVRSLGHLVYWGLVLSVWGGSSPRRAFRLLREPAAPDRSARRPQATAQHRHPLRRRLAYRQSRRHRRARGQAHRSAALSAQGLRRHRGQAILRP